jgi:hypothetical protein
MQGVTAAGKQDWEAYVKLLLGFAVPEHVGNTNTSHCTAALLVLIWMFAGPLASGAHPALDDIQPCTPAQAAAQGQHCSRR